MSSICRDYDSVRAQIRIVDGAESINDRLNRLGGTFMKCLTL